MKTLLFIGGIYHVAFAVFHLSFWKLFGWKSDLAKLNRINRSIMQILNLRLIFVFLIFAAVSLFYADELLETRIGKFLLTGISLFWLARAVEQIVFFGLKQIASLLLFVAFLIGTIIYLVPLF